MAIIQKGWKEAALPVKSSSCNLSSLPREKSPMKPALRSWEYLLRKNTVSTNVTEKYCLRTFKPCREGLSRKEEFHLLAGTIHFQEDK